MKLKILRMERRDEPLFFSLAFSGMRHYLSFVTYIDLFLASLMHIPISPNYRVQFTFGLRVRRLTVVIGIII